MPSTPATPSVAPPDNERLLGVERRTAFKGYFQIGEYRFRHSLYQGGAGPEIKREVFERGHAAAVLPFDPVAGRVVLIRQFRPGAHVAGRHPWIWEIVAGIIEPGESAADVARREAMEEANLAITDLWPMHSFLVSPGGTSETSTQFLGRVDSSRAGGVHGLVEEGENILVRTFDLAELRAMLDRDEIGSASGLAAAQWLLLNLDAVRARWK